MKIRLIVVLSLIVLAVFSVGNIALGQDEATESVTTSYYGTYKGLPLGPDSRYVTWESFGVLISDTSKGLFHGTTIHCMGTSLYGKESWDSESYCAYTMKDGEKVFSTGKMGGKVAKPPVPGKGTAKFIGGTGKYSGIQGGTEFVTYSLRPPSDGTMHVYNKVKMTYKLPTN
ncbi:MAG: hypothetical protein ABSC54_11045 [Smithellaceae bacterium]|jgi:hypothetical protein